jgi:hypothetical protein
VTPLKCALHELQPGELADSERYVAALEASRTCLRCRALALFASIQYRRHRAEEQRRAQRSAREPKASTYIAPGAKCACCRERPATMITRLVARNDDMPGDGLFWGAATCEGCVSKLGKMLERVLTGALQ